MKKEALGLYVETSIASPSIAIPCGCAIFELIVAPQRVGPSFHGQLLTLHRLALACRKRTG
jgi:hypothetical protein